MLVDNDGAVTVGSPVIEGAKVVVEILSHVKGDKVLISKEKEKRIPETERPPSTVF